MNIGERIKKLRKTLDLTQQKFGEKLGIKGNTVAQYELGRNEPIDAVLSLICREFNVNDEWLRTGSGEMFNPVTTDALDQLAQKYQLSNTDCAIVEKFVSLRPEIRAGIFDFFREVVSVVNGNEQMSKEHHLDETTQKALELFRKNFMGNDIPKTPEELEEEFPPVDIEPERKEGSGTG